MQKTTSIVRHADCKLSFVQTYLHACKSFTIVNVLQAIHGNQIKAKHLQFKDEFHLSQKWKNDIDRSSR